jgi:CBS domain-containing protein/cytochrome c553
MTVALRVRDFMVTDLLVVEPGAEVMSVARLLVENDVSGAVVVDQGYRAVGILTERDFIEAALYAGYFDERAGRVSEFMTTDLETVGPDDNLVDVAARFVKSPYRRFPVIEDGRLVGIIARRDVLRALRSGSWFYGIAFSLVVSALLAPAPADIGRTNARTALEDSFVAGCRGCHRGDLSLAGVKAAELAEAIRAIARGEAEHIVPIAPLSNEDLDALVKALTEAVDASANAAIDAVGVPKA